MRSIIHMTTRGHMSGKDELTVTMPDMLTTWQKKNLFKPNDYIYTTGVWINHLGHDSVY